MAPLVPILIAVIFVSLAALVMGLVLGRAGGKGNAGARLESRDRAQVLKDVDRRLASNPKDPDALQVLGSLYWTEMAWENVFKTYSILAETATGNPELDEFTFNARLGIAAVRLGRTEEAYKGLLIARTFRQDDFDVNFNLGLIELQKRQYEKALVLLEQAVQAKPEHSPSLRSLGQVQFKLRLYREALGNLRKAAELEPEVKESLFAMGECYFELGQNEQAARIFSHLRADPRLGPNASLFAGTLHINMHQYIKAIQDFEIGLKHQDIPVETLVELKYRLAAAFLRSQELAKAVTVLNEIQSIFPNYKDVPAQLAKYQELNSNRNLQIYLMGATGDFVTLCRRVALSFFPKARVKITDISVNKNDWADILTEVETTKWQEIVLFRFIRSTGLVGELAIRDFHARIKDVKAGRGYFVSAGTFSDEARRFVEARLLDLMGKDSLARLLNAIDAGGGEVLAD